jgi:flagellin
MTVTATTNTAANTAIRYLSINNANTSSSLAKLSSGSRIVKASDDAASLAIGTKLMADVNALRVASMNASHGSSLLQVADGGMAGISDILQRMKVLSVQAQSGSVTDDERAFLDVEYQELRTQVQDIASQTRFNNAILLNGSAGKSITLADQDVVDNFETRGITVRLSGDATAATYTLAFADGTNTFTLSNDEAGDPTVETVVVDGTEPFSGVIEFASSGISVQLQNFDTGTDLAANNTFVVAGDGSLTFQVGVRSTDTIVVNIDNVSEAALGIDATDITTAANAVTAGNALDTAISSVNEARANTGAMISRFEFVSANLATSIENLDAARSSLMDVDMAEEMSRFTSAQVLTQAATAMLAQANQLPQNLLRLLQ